jgi:hypothetical protein
MVIAMPGPWFAWISGEYAAAETPCKTGILYRPNGRVKYPFFARRLFRRERSHYIRRDEF